MFQRYHLNFPIVKSLVNAWMKAVGLGTLDKVKNH